MAANQKPEKPLYSIMMANGSSYLFIKTLGKQYAVSYLVHLTQSDTFIAY
ncbi:MAG: hypothetical protein PUP92_31430 [Rhizonema sp. PD38]|nr:hypothetical protein [Rhizonema sp. PD38]